MIQLKSIEHDYIRILKSQYYKQMSSLCRKEHVGLGNLGQWFPLGVAFCYWIFLFSRSKASDANIGIIANVVYL